MFIQKLESWLDSLVLLLIEIKNVVELTSAFFECASPLAESEHFRLCMEDIVKRLKVHRVQILDFLHHWSQVNLPFCIVNCFSICVMFLHPFISGFPSSSSYSQKIFLFFSFKIVLILMFFEQLHIHCKLRVSVRHKVPHIHVSALVQEDTQKLFLVRDLFLEDGLCELFETSWSKLSKRTFFERQVVSFVDLTLVHEVVDTNCVCLIDHEQLVRCELEVLKEEVDHVESFLIWHSFLRNLSLRRLLNLWLLCDVLINFFFLFFFVNLWVVFNYDNKHLWPDSWFLVHKAKTSSKVAWYWLKVDLDLLGVNIS